MAKNKNKIHLTLIIKPTKPKKPKKPQPLFYLAPSVYLKYLLIPTTRLFFCRDKTYTNCYFIKEIPFSFRHIKTKNGQLDFNVTRIFLDVSPHITTEDYEKIFIKSKPSKPTT
jgi:hypothetical protein